MRYLILLQRFGENALAFSVLAIAMLVGVAVVFRYGLNAPLYFSFEGSTLIFGWVTFIGAALATASNSHIGVDLISGRLTPRLRTVLHAFRLAVVLGCALYLVWAGTELTMRGRGKIPSLDIPNAWLYAALPIGFTLVAIISFARIVTLILCGSGYKDDADHKTGDNQ